MAIQLLLFFNKITVIPLLILTKYLVLYGRIFYNETRLTGIIIHNYMDYNTGFYCFFTGEGKQLQLDVHKTLINLSKYTRISKLEVGRMTFETIENVLNINTDAIMTLAMAAVLLVIGYFIKNLQSLTGIVSRLR